MMISQALVRYVTDPTAVPSRTRSALGAEGRAGALLRFRFRRPSSALGEAEPRPAQAATR
ncbi:hypothetical protein WOLCODRAFT_29191 [Wolfiporia cocos MD-104 SS10]|uniref:Uncharacterized protein n=1 Tax=Wolfiporia cocos (strain MD-104) TaxID=742152 RepID=A0A2H3JCP2_WOLCO|nr:hypothetical protein WOLCODRAFT_29191 [Wolfiporia cocos MD-104 SS10]